MKIHEFSCLMPMKWRAVSFTLTQFVLRDVRRLTECVRRTMDNAIIVRRAGERVVCFRILFGFGESVAYSVSPSTVALVNFLE